jgi:hypothetical protein
MLNSLKPLNTVLNALIWGNLGSCSLCIRKAFLTACGAWSLSLFCYILWQTAFFYSVVVAVVLSALWLAHIAAFAGKIKFVASKGTSNRSSLSRRELVPLFARGLAIGAIISAAPRQALADGACGADGCDSCFRPIYARDGTRVCQRCHSCADSQGRYNCGGATC